jgi:hypothetical protein
MQEGMGDESTDEYLGWACGFLPGQLGIGCILNVLSVDLNLSFNRAYI